MKYNPEIHKRRSIRLKGYDYSQAGLYFITICVQNRECLFGNVENDEIILNDAGKMIETEWLNLKKHFPKIELHEYITMPNHFHGILVGATLVVAQNHEPQNVVAQNHEPQNVVHPNDYGDNERGQPQGIAENHEPQNVVAQNHEPQNVVHPNDYGDNERGQPQGIAPTAKTIGDMMDAFKSITTVEYIRGIKNFCWHPFDGKLWQRNYYEHIIRNKQSYQTISNYIINNPSKWKEDKFYGL